MFSKKFRLPINDVGGKLRKLSITPYFTVKSANNGLEHNRFGIIISASSIKKSTERHLWKRRIAGSLAGWPNLNQDFLFIVSPKIKTLDKSSVKKEIDRILDGVK